MNKVLAIIFDVGNILIYDFPMESRFLYNIYLKAKNKIGLTFEQFLKLKENYQLPYNQWIYSWGESFFKDKWRMINKSAWDDVLFHWDESCILIHGVVEKLYEYKNEYRFAICANQPEATINFLRSEKILAYFETVIIDDWFEYSKPDHRMFSTVLQKLNLLPNDCIMVGDKYKVDIEPATTLGLCTALILNDYDQMQKVAKYEWEYDYIQYMRDFSEATGPSDFTILSVADLFNDIGAIVL